MSETKYTAGPWEVYETPNYIGVRASDGRVMSMAISALSVHREKGLANARLVAAAPDLLEALRALQLQALQSEVNSPANEWGREALEMTRDALAKATGAAP